MRRHFTQLRFKQNLAVMSDRVIVIATEDRRAFFGRNDRRDRLTIGSGEFIDTRSINRAPLCNVRCLAYFWLLRSTIDRLASIG